MKKKALGIVVASAFAVAAIGAPVAAEPNANACVGQYTVDAAQEYGGLHYGQLGLEKPGQFKKYFVFLYCGRDSD
jgi:hypothetical protein